MNKQSKSFLVFVSIVLIVILFIGCGELNQKSPKSADQKQVEQTKQIMDEVSNQIGMPNIKNFQQKKMMKMILELCDKEDLICYAYIKSDYQGKLVYIGKCLGYGIPFSAQYTNPMRIWDAEQDGGAAPKYQDAGEIQVVPQADPNGLFMPTSSSATWLMMIDPETNTPRVVYIEPEIVVSPFKLY